MKALMLAAGSGRRLGDSHDQPKALLKFGGRSLLARHIDILRQCGIDALVLAVGYQQEMIAEEIEAIGARDFVKTVFNPQYEHGSVISLWTLSQALRAGDDILLMDADVLYDARMVQRLIDTSVENCFLLDGNIEPGDEPVKICVRDNKPVEFRKIVDPNLDYEHFGESVGFFRFSGKTATLLAERCEHYINNGLLDEHYEEAIRDLLLQNGDPEFGFEDITGLPWLEIDFPEDIKKAETEILPKLIPSP